MSGEYKKHIDLLGMRAEDRVTGLRGVITSISFDVSGCVQGALTPGATEQGTLPEGRWFDVPRLRILEGHDRVIALPNFDSGYVAEGKKGPCDKPVK